MQKFGSNSEIEVANLKRRVSTLEQRIVRLIAILTNVIDMQLNIREVSFAEKLSMIEKLANLKKDLRNT